jgi:hypothetical protein
LVPDPQTDLTFYLFGVTGLDFFPGEVIHADITITTDGTALVVAAVLDSAFIPLALNQTFSGGTVTIPVDYTVVAGDDADGVVVGAQTDLGEVFTLVDVNFSCIPAS